MYVKFYGRFYGKVDACANGVFQALSPPLKGPGDEATYVCMSTVLACVHYIIIIIFS